MSLRCAAGTAFEVDPSGSVAAAASPPVLREVPEVRFRSTRASLQRAVPEDQSGVNNAGSWLAAPLGTRRPLGRSMLADLSTVLKRRSLDVHVCKMPICQLGPTDAVCRGIRRRPVRFGVVVMDVTDVETLMALRARCLSVKNMKMTSKPFRPLSVGLERDFYLGLIGR